MKALYRTVDLLALRLAPEQTCSVVEDQREGEIHVHVWRTGQPTPERIREEDLMVYGGKSDARTTTN